jgi:hypothetical protein
MKPYLQLIHKEKCNVLSKDFLYVPSYKTDLARVLREKYGFIPPSQQIFLKEVKK